MARAAVVAKGVARDAEAAVKPVPLPIPVVYDGGNVVGHLFLPTKVEIISYTPHSDDGRVDDAPLDTPEAQRQLASQAAHGKQVRE